MPKTTAVPALIGSRITKVRKVDANEAGTNLGIELDGRTELMLAIELDSGVTVFALCDPEGNGAGHLVGTFKDQMFDIYPEPN